MLLDIEEKENSLVISYFNSEGTVSYKEYDTKDVYNYALAKPGDKYVDRKYTNWDNAAIKRYKGRKFNDVTIYNFLESLPEEDANLIFGTYMPNIYFFDIETEIIEGGPDAKNAPGQVLTISLVTPDEKAIVFGLKDLSQKEQGEIANDINERFKDFDANFQFIYKKFESEYDMIYTFMTMASKLPMLSGWYCIDFDWTYLVSRCRKLNIDPTISSPSGKLKYKDNTPYHVGLLDYKAIYMGWDRSIKPKENGKLETAGKQVLGMGKVQHEGFENMYENDFKKYAFYNAVDSIMVYYIDKKLRTMQVVLTLANICKMSLYRADSPVAITESVLSRNLLHENKIMARDFDKPEVKSEKYIGAFVKQPIAGRYRGVACFDFASLYPSLMRQFNISPDVYVENVPKTNIDKIREDNLGKRIVTSSGAVYSAEESILRRVLSRLYSSRREYKNTSWDYDLKIKELDEIIKNK